MNILKFLSFGSGASFSNEVADELGVNRRLYMTAMFEAGVSTRMLDELRKAGMSSREVGTQFVPVLMEGLDLLEEKFGEQELIKEARIRATMAIGD